MFDEKIHENEKFKNLEHTNQVFENFDFFECEFVNCNFSSAEFRNCEFTSCAFEECDLSLVKVNRSIFNGVQFSKSRLIGINWALATWKKNKLSQIQKPVSFADCVLNYSSFSGLQLERVQLQKCVAHEVDFAEANLKGSNLRGTDFEKSIFNQTNLEEADLVGARNYYIPPALNRMKNARFSLPEAMALLYSMDIRIEENLGE